MIYRKIPQEKITASRGIVPILTVVKNKQFTVDDVRTNDVNMSKIFVFTFNDILYPN